MRLEFFPSPTLTRYLAKQFITWIVGMLLVLVLLLQTLDLLSESGKILGAAGNGQAELWHYVMLRVPQLVQRLNVQTLFTEARTRAEGRVPTGNPALRPQPANPLTR